MFRSVYFIVVVSECVLDDVIVADRRVCFCHPSGSPLLSAIARWRRKLGVVIWEEGGNQMFNM
jgi:hypothetical protein